MRRLMFSVLVLTFAARAAAQSADDLFQQGYRAGMTGNNQQAIELLNRAIQIDPRHDRALATRAGVYSTLGRHELALADINRALELKPGFGPYRGQRAVVYREQGDLVRALDDADAGVVDEPRNALNYLIRGGILLTMGAAADAQGEFEFARYIGTGNPGGFTPRDEQYLTAERARKPRAYRQPALKGTLEEATAFLANRQPRLAAWSAGRTVTASPANARAWLLLGQSLRQLRQWQIAGQALTRASQLDPGIPAAYRLLGDVAIAFKRDQDAVALFTRAIELNNAYYEAHISRARAWSYLGAKTGGAPMNNALADANRAVQLEPKLALSYSVRSQVFIFMGRPADALKDLETIVQLEPTDAVAACNLAVAYRDMNNKPAANQALQRCYGLDVSQKPYYDAMMAQADYRDQLSAALRATPASTRGKDPYLERMHNAYLASLRSDEASQQTYWACMEGRSGCR